MAFSNRSKLFLTTEYGRLTTALVSVRYTQDRGLIEVLPQNLHSDRQFFRCLATRNRNPRNARQVRRHCVNIRQVHCERIIYFFAKLERRSRTCWCHDYVDFRKCVLEITREQRTHFLCLEVIRVVITCAQGVAPEHDAALYLRAKALIAS